MRYMFKNQLQPFRFNSSSVGVHELTNIRKVVGKSHKFKMRFASDFDVWYQRQSSLVTSDVLDYFGTSPDVCYGTTMC